MPNPRRWFYLVTLAVFTLITLQYFYDASYTGRPRAPPGSGGRPDFVNKEEGKQDVGAGGAGGPGARPVASPYVGEVDTSSSATEEAGGSITSSTSATSTEVVVEGGSATSLATEEASASTMTSATSALTTSGTGSTTTTTASTPSTAKAAAPTPTTTSSADTLPETSSTALRWSKPSEKYPVTSFYPIPTSTTQKIPAIQHKFGQEDPSAKTIRLRRRAAVKALFQKSWSSYKTHALPHDELLPVAQSYHDTPILLGWGATLIDSLDTLWLMGLTQEFEKAVEVVGGIDFWKPGGGGNSVPVFEVNIRYLGGLLGGYDVSGGKYHALLDKAAELGELLYAAFDTAGRMPMMWFEWRASMNESAHHDPASTTLLSELGTLSLEFTRLSQLTGDPKFYDAVHRIALVLEEHQNRTFLPGMWPIFLDAGKLNFKTNSSNEFTLGGMSDSAYEYLPKTYLLLSGADSSYRSMYETTLPVLKQHVFYRPMTPSNTSILLSGLTRFTNPNTSYLDPQGQHLACFAGGMVALAAKIFGTEDVDIQVAKQLVDGCLWAYRSTPTGLMPETFWAVPCENQTAGATCPWDEGSWLDAVYDFHKGDFSDDDRPAANDRAHRHKLARGKVAEKHLPEGFAGVRDRGWFLRPEAVESLFVMYRVTGEQKWADAAWELFETVANLTATAVANAGVEDVMVPPGDGRNGERVRLLDRMESFWLAETLKYFFLVFEEPGIASLDEWVLNTEAHLLRRGGGGGGNRGRRRGR